MAGLHVLGFQRTKVFDAYWIGNLVKCNFIK